MAAHSDAVDASEACCSIAGASRGQQHSSVQAAGPCSSQRHQSCDPPHIRRLSRQRLHCSTTQPHAADVALQGGPHGKQHSSAAGSAGSAQRLQQLGFTHFSVSFILMVMLAAVIASPNLPAWFAASALSSAQMTVATAMLEAAVLLYLNHLLPETGRLIMGMVMRVGPKAAAVLAAFAVPAHVQASHQHMPQAGSLSAWGKSSMAIGWELMWYSALYALPSSLHVPVVLMEWLLLTYTYSTSSVGGMDVAATARSVLLQAGLVLATTTPLSVAAQHIWAKARMLQAELQRGPSSTVDVHLEFTASKHSSKGCSPCSTIPGMHGEQLHQMPAARATTATEAHHERGANAPQSDGVSAEGLRGPASHGPLAAAVQQTLQLAASHALAPRDAAHEAQQRQQALQHVAHALGANIAALVAASAPSDALDGLPRAPKAYVGRCRVEPVSIVMRQRQYLPHNGAPLAASLDRMATAMLDSLEASAGVAAGSSQLPWHVHATCVMGAPASGDAAPAAYVGSAASKMQHEQLRLYMNEVLAHGAQNVPTPLF